MKNYFVWPMAFVAAISLAFFAFPVSHALAEEEPPNGYVRTSTSWKLPNKAYVTDDLPSLAVLADPNNVKTVPDYAVGDWDCQGTAGQVGDLNVHRFEFNLPSTAYDLALEVRIRCFAEEGSASTDPEELGFLLIQLFDNTGVLATASDPNQIGPIYETEQNYTFGSSTDDWGGVLTETIVEKNRFGAGFIFSNQLFNCEESDYELNVKWVKMKIHYSIPAN